MEKWIGGICALLFFNIGQAQNIQILDSLDQSPISYATIAFGNGLGTFADEEGMFLFSKNKYKDVDTIYISSIGYNEKIIPVAQLPEKIYVQPDITALEEVIVSVPKRGKFKTKKQKHTTHTDLFTSWLPTIESEVAVYFTRYGGKSTQISKLYLPINAESKYKSKGKGDFATFFRIQFYENKEGLPGKPISHNKIVFSIDADEDKVFTLDISDQSIFIPENGIYASLQVLGYANDKGNLSKAKKYYEIETKRGFKKISVAYRPLLPFTNKLIEQDTYVRRLFSTHKKWQVFDISYNKNSKLVQSGYDNYGMGQSLKCIKIRRNV